jgi:hypothetical protein
MKAENLLNYLLELENQGHDLSKINLNFRINFDSDVEKINFCFEDLFCEKDNATLKSLIFLTDDEG